MSTNVKLENTKAKVRISKATRERRQISGKLTNLWQIDNNLPKNTGEARRQWSNIFKML